MHTHATKKKQEKTFFFLFFFSSLFDEMDSDFPRLSAKVVALIFFLAVLIGTWSFRPDFGHGPHLLTSLKSGAANDGSVPYPQITICPLWDDGIIQNVRCYDGGKLANGTKTGQQLMTKVVYGGAKPGKPAWNCTTVNYNAVIPNSADFGVWCDVNSTNAGYNGNTSIAWPGRVVVSVHQPGQLPPLAKCVNCFDGANFAVVAAGTTGLLFFQAHVYEMADNTSIEYRVQHSSVNIPTELASVETSNMDFAVNYLTPDAIVYREIHVLASQIGGEKFGQFVVLVGGAGIFSWALFACLKTTLVLFFLGKDALTAGERQPMI